MSSDPAPAASEVQPAPHVPVEVAGGVVRAGAATRRFRQGDVRSLLTAYLALIRGVRDQRRARAIELRRADIESLANHLGLTGTEVVERLAELMGATRAQRTTMVTLFGAGALVIGLAGSTAAVRAEPGPGSGVEPAITLGAHVSPVPLAAEAPVAVTAADATTTTTTTTVPVVAPDTVAASSAPPAPVAEAPPTIVDQPVVTTAPRPAPTPVEPRPEPDDTVPTTDAAPDTTIVTDIGTPPVPPAPDTTIVTDIGSPPVPPAPDTTVVTDIGSPPIPPGSEPAPDTTEITDIGTPPVPPSTDPVSTTVAG